MSKEKAILRAAAIFLIVAAFFLPPRTAGAFTLGFHPAFSGDIGLNGTVKATDSFGLSLFLVQPMEEAGGHIDNMDWFPPQFSSAAVYFTAIGCGVINPPPSCYQLKTFGSFFIPVGVLPHVFHVEAWGSPSALFLITLPDTVSFFQFPSNYILVRGTPGIADWVVQLQDISAPIPGALPLFATGLLTAR